jgi:hypothetical protein
MVMAMKHPTAMRGSAEVRNSQPNTRTMRNQAYIFTILLDSLYRF